MGVKVADIDRWIEQNNIDDFQSVFTNISALNLNWVIYKEGSRSYKTKWDDQAAAARLEAEIYDINKKAEKSMVNEPESSLENNFLFEKYSHLPEHHKKTIRELITMYSKKAENQK